MFYNDLKNRLAKHLLKDIYLKIEKLQLENPEYNRVPTGAVLKRICEFNDDLIDLD